MGAWARLRRWFLGDHAEAPKRERLGYDAATVGRRDGGWTRAGTDSASETAQAGSVRGRARELVRNDAHAFAGVSVLVNNLVGDGIKPRAATGDEELDDRTNDLWQRWAEEASSDGQLDATGVQLLAARGLVESGEVLLRRRWRRLSDGLVLPVQVELLEADHLALDKTELLASGNQVIQGVEADLRGRRVAYWVYPTHPGSSVLLAGWTDAKRVAASEISHCYEPLRPGQVRGVSWLAPVIVRLMALNDYTDAELERKRL